MMLLTYAFSNKKLERGQGTRPRWHDHPIVMLIGVYHIYEDDFGFIDLYFSLGFIE
jgi:hypothetical protein